MAEPTAEEVQFNSGKLISGKVTDSVSSKIEKGQMDTVNALIIHQTGGSTAKSTLESYKKDGANGAHFLIDTDGTIHQTARVDQKCWHIGKIRSKCYELKSCTEDELKTVKGILFKPKRAYTLRVDDLHDHESAKAYPDRYPTNEDSVGIELVGAADKDGKYADVTKEQNDSLVWLVGVLLKEFGREASDVFRHPEVSYKQPSEASTANWTGK